MIMTRTPPPSLRNFMMIAIMAATAVASGPAQPPPQSIFYEGTLSEPGGSGLPLTPGDYVMRFRLFDQAEGGSLAWAELREGSDPDTGAVTVTTGGYFGVHLGQITPLLPVLASHEALWIEIAVDLDSSGTIDEPDEVYAPRQRLTSVPYALLADRAQMAASLGVENLVIAAQSGGDFSSISEALASVSPTAEDPVMIFVAPGVYSEAITVPSYVHLLGPGPEQATIVASGVPSAVFVDGAEGVAITGMTVSAELHGVFTFNGSQARFEDLVVETELGDAFRIIGEGSDVVISGCHVQQAGARGVNIDQAVMERVLVEDSLIERTGLAEDPALGGEGAVGGTNTTYQRVTFRDISSIIGGAALTLRPEGTIVRDCVIENIDGQGIVVFGSSAVASEETRIENTLIRDTEVALRTFDQDPGGHATFERCTVERAEFVGVRGEGGLTVSGCTFIDTPVAVEITNTTSQAVIMGNSVLPRAGAATGSITVGPDVDALVIRNIFDSASVAPSASVSGGDNITLTGDPLGLP
jgi:parallel beta helix pectate lyase-like protein